MYYALVLETDGYEFLIDTRDLWRPECVYLRRGCELTAVWLGHPVSFAAPPRLRPAERKRALALVREHRDELLDRWFSLKDDVCRDRLERNLLVE